MTSDEKLTALRALAEGWATGAFTFPNDPAAQVRGECATAILEITDPAS
jgi:hypothetical protein